MNIVIASDVNLNIYDNLQHVFPNDISIWRTQDTPLYDIIDESPIDVIFCNQDLPTNHLNILQQEVKIHVVLVPHHMELCNHNLHRTNDKTPTYNTDILIISDVQQNNELLQPIMNVNNNLNIKIVGPERYMCIEYLGNPPEVMLNDLIRHTKIVLDMNHNIWKCPYNNTFAVATYDNPLYPKYEDIQTLIHFLKEHKHRASYTKKAKAYIKKNKDTYMHWLAGQLQNVNPEYSKQLVQHGDLLL